MSEHVATRTSVGALPAGIVTFLFTDIEGSTQLLTQHGEAMRDALNRHHAILQHAVEVHAGRVFNIIGDAFCCAFVDAADAAAAALDAQRALDREPWGAIGRLRVRMGLHTGAAEPREGGEYVSSLTLVRAQRVMAAGHGGQTLASGATAGEIRERLPAATTLRDLGAHKLRGLPEPEPIFQLVTADLPSSFPPLRGEESPTSSAGLLNDLVRGRLVGRDPELGQLRAHWQQALQARGHLVLVSGEPGIGKTRLAQELVDEARRAGATLLRGGCYEYEATTPYLPFVEAFREWARLAPAPAMRDALRSMAAEIAKFAPEIETKLGALAPNPPLAPADERLRLFDNVARFLRALAAPRGLLLFVDDLHWADQGTLSLMHYLLRHLASDRILILAAYREIELGRTHPLARSLVEWNRERLVARISLARLSRQATGAMLAVLFSQASVAPEFADVVHRETEGNPFFVEEVVKSLIEQGEITRDNDEWFRKEAHELTIPQSVKEAIGRRLDRLSEGAVETLRTAAALGKSFSFHELKAVSADDEDTLLDALDEANAAQLICIDERATKAGLPGDGFAFTHDKIREVLYEELNPVRRRRLHQRIGEALQALYAARTEGSEAGAGEHAQDLAYHFAQAGDLERSLVYSRRAADAAERVFAHDEALKFLEQARESADALRRADDVAAVDERLGDIHVARGSIRTALEHYERALAATASREARAALKVKVGNACAPLGDPHGLARLEEALTELDPGTQTRALALATALVGRYHHYRTRHESAIEFLERARALAEPLDDPPALCWIYGYLAGAHQHLLQYDASNRWARACIALGERTNYPEAIATGNEFLAENAAGRGVWDEAIAYAALDEQAGRRSGSIARVAWSGFPRAQGLWGKGQLEAARDATFESLALCAQIGEHRLGTWLEANAAIVLADLGDIESARAHADRGWAAARDLDQLVLSAWTLHGLGYVAMMADDVPRAVEWYEQYIALLGDSENKVARNLSLARAAEAFVLAGQLDRAADIVAQAIAVAERGRTPHYIGLARCVQGRLFAAKQRDADARAAFDAALALYAPLGSRLEIARTSFHRAALALRQGEREAARRDAASALAQFTAMGAARDRALAQGLLEDCGR